ncbi:MAG: four helix bundle protein [Patescibacteria group bacterium]|nr:four helix bundle protein [Patescibacteria group bacterium]
MEKKKFDLEERAARFGEDVIGFAEDIPKTIITTPLIDQLIRSATSVGANLCEADCAESRKDFIHKMGICNKEAKESKHWLRMIAKAAPRIAPEARMFWKEAHELNLIFVTIIKNTKEKSAN